MKTRKKPLQKSIYDGAKEGHRRYTFLVKIETHKEIKALAQHRGGLIREIMNEALEQYLDRRREEVIKALEAQENEDTSKN